MIRFLAHLWAFPVTIFGLIYAELFRLLRWYYFYDCIDGARVYRLHDNAPAWLQRLWKGWGGHAIGEVVVISSTDLYPTMLHELEHVRQCRVFGPLQPILYGLFSLVLLACPCSSPYRDNPFEREARRATGLRDEPN